MSDIQLECNNVKKYFSTPKGVLHAVDDISFALEKGKALGVVGESGCGKSTLGRTILGLLPRTDGDIKFEGKSIVGVNRKEWAQLRKEMQIIFQDPYSSLNPRMTVGEAIKDPLKVNGMYKGIDQIYSIMERVGLDKRYFNTYPHEMDGGRRQRIGIAKALSLEPKFILCDEPVSALDVSIQAQILNLMMDLKDELGLTYMFITHDLSVVKHISDDIMVLYMGKMAEMTSSDELFRNPLHPYTKALLSAIPIPKLSYRGKKAEIMTGEVSSPINPPPCCRFAARCKYAIPICRKEVPVVKEVEANHHVACHLF